MNSDLLHSSVTENKTDTPHSSSFYVKNVEATPPRRQEACAVHTFH